MTRCQEVKLFAESDRYLSVIGGAEAHTAVTLSVCLLTGKCDSPGFVLRSGQGSGGGQNVEVLCLGSVEQSVLQSRTGSDLADCGYMEG